MKVELDGNADAVEFCPNGSAQELLAAATYNLVEATDESGEQRLGSISLFRAESCLELLDRVTTPGVFDIRWRPAGQGSEPLLAQAGADGNLSIYSLTDERKLCKVASSEVTTSMCLFVEWNPFGTCEEQQMVVSRSDGSVSTVSLSGGSLAVETSWEAHAFEVWTASYDSWTRGLVYSGADDSNFCGWDLRGSLEVPVFRDMKSHQMGVCCVQSSPLWENVVATGSYDEHLRLWDIRMLQRPFMKQRIGLGGGVWKVKWHPVKKDVLLAACMHNGFAIVQAGEETINVVEEYKEHKSLAYGADWARGGSEHIATCSFYDKSLHLWKPVDEKVHF